MATLLDPTALPADAIQRVLFIAPSVHVYAIPPLTTTKGYTAATWTLPTTHQFPLCRLRILEACLPSESTLSTTVQPNPSSSHTANPSPSSSHLSVSILLEDPLTADLFAACPYISSASVEQVLDSSRFFAIRVLGEGGRKATLGIGFEERSEAVDFSIALQDVRKVLGLNRKPPTPQKGKPATTGKRDENTSTTIGTGKEVKRDWSLREGDSIRVEIGEKGRRRRDEPDLGGGGGTRVGISPGWIAPPSGGFGEGGGLGFLPPPPSANEVKDEKRRSRSDMPAVVDPKGMEALGFDDGEFGEFQ